jgi:hypothetical protein
MVRARSRRSFPPHYCEKNSREKFGGDDFSRGRRRVSRRVEAKEEKQRKRSLKPDMIPKMQLKKQCRKA